MANTTPSTLCVMNCPACGASTQVLETRSAEGGSAIRRRRRCKECGRRFTSFERREHEPAWVVKRSGERQRFDRAKLRSGLVRASHKRDVDPRDLELIVDRIEDEAEASGGEITTGRIGELCLAGLERLDRGAYLQFAGTLPDPDENPRNNRESGSPVSVRAKEEARRPTQRERTRGVG
jgi:transcriptional repressor NrdR